MKNIHIYVKKNSENVNVKQIEFSLGAYCDQFFGATLI